MDPLLLGTSTPFHDEQTRLSLALRARDEFLVAMSHELRTPLNAILGLAEILCEGLYGALEEPQRRAVATISSSGQHLLSLINDILDLAKIEAGREELALATVAPLEICRLAIDLLAHTARRAGVTIAEQLPDTVSPIVADARRLCQILMNLLANAVDFTPAGGEVGLALEQLGDTLRFCIWDTGPGIAPEQQERLFYAFAQAEGSTRRSPIGTGLGLALVARLARLHGGSVALASSAGQGSRFTVTIPSAVAPAAGSAARPGAGAVLLFDSQEATARLLHAALWAEGYRTVAARSMVEACELLRLIAPRAIVAALPVDDHQGALLLPRLRAAAGDTPIVAVGSVLLSNSAAWAVAAGASTYLALPVQPEALSKTLQEICRQ
jgi:CheY-like chemotaxis protein/two-component sensor histidine kinase